MAHPGFNTFANQSSYDVVIIGGAMIGSSIAWFLSDNPDFKAQFWWWSATLVMKILLQPAPILVFVSNFQPK